MLITDILWLLAGVMVIFWSGYGLALWLVWRHRPVVRQITGRCDTGGSERSWWMTRESGVAK